MNKVKVNLAELNKIDEEAYYRYPDPWKQIAGWMRVKGLRTIGDGKRWEGRERPAGLDLDREDRCWRTFRVLRFTDEELVKVHEAELKAGNFLNSIQMYYVLKKPVPSGGMKCNIRATQESLMRLNDENRPECWKIDGISVPPYFQLDLSFDGAEYHHRWDRLVKAAGFAWEPVYTSTPTKVVERL